jgi:hypothetical protein
MPDGFEMPSVAAVTGAVRDGDRWLVQIGEGPVEIGVDVALNEDCALTLTCNAEEVTE